MVMGRYGTNGRVGSNFCRFCKVCQTGSCTGQILGESGKSGKLKKELIDGMSFYRRPKREKVRKFKH
jgi:hypothetical protein